LLPALDRADERAWATQGRKDSKWGDRQCGRLLSSVTMAPGAPAELAAALAAVAMAGAVAVLGLVVVVLRVAPRRPRRFRRFGRALLLLLRGSLRGSLRLQALLPAWRGRCGRRSLTNVTNYEKLKSSP